MMQYSVLMSVYINEKAEYFKKALDSMINQTISPSEIVLVCDGKLTDELDDLIEEFIVNYPNLFKVIRLEKNRGLGLALQEGLKHCTYDLIARMDADDIAYLDRLEKQVKLFESDSQIAAVGGQIEEFVGDVDNIVSYREVPTTFEDVKTRIKKRNPMNHMTVTFKKEAVMNVGSYENYPGFEDYHLWAKLVANGYKLCNIDDICCSVRTDKNLYKRRGGLKYFKNTIHLEKYLLNEGLINYVQYHKNLFIRFVGTVVVNNKLRGILFVKFLRK